MSEEYVNNHIEEKENLIIDEHNRYWEGDYGQREILCEPEGDWNDYLSFYNDEEEEVRFYGILKSSEENLDQHTDVLTEELEESS